jgi:hypothetical protein
MRRRAIIRFSDIELKAGLKIRADLDIFEVTFNPLTGITELLLGGEGLPPCGEACMPIAVDMETVS